MCLTSHSDPRIRRMVGIGMIFLVLSFAMQGLSHSLRVDPALLHFVRGVFLGICLTMEMRALWLARRLRREG